MPSRRQVLAVSGAVAAGLAGCSTLDSDPPPVDVRRDQFRSEDLWPSFNGHSANTAYSPSGRPIRSEPSVAWRAPVDSGLGYLVVGPRRVFYPDGNVLRAFDAADGTERWRRTAAEPGDESERGIASPPAYLRRVSIDDGPELVVVAVAGAPNELRAYTVGGDPAWRTQTPAGGRPVGGPAYEPRTNRVCVGTTAERVLCVEGRTGDVVWSRRVFGAVEAVPATNEKSVIVATTAGEVYSLATADGRGIWRASLDAGTHCAPAMAGRLTLVIDDGGRLYGLDGTGETAWRNDLGTVANYLGVTTDGQRAYFVDPVGGPDELVAADVRTGERAWSVGIGNTGRLPAVVGDLVYVASGDTVAAFATGDTGPFEGRRRWHWNPDGRASGPVVAAGGRLFLPVSGDSNELVALE